MIIFFHLKKKMKNIPVKYDVPKDSTINLFDIKNLVYVYELIKIVFFYKFTNMERYKKYF